MTRSFSCHLESADTVRTNPSKKFVARHRQKLFAEAFVHILFGQRIHSGQVPLFDSHGLVQFIAETIDAKAELDKGRGTADRFATPFLPFLMTHYPGLGNGHTFNNKESVFWETVANRIASTKFELSSMPGLQQHPELRKKLSDAIKNQKSIATQSISQDIYRELEEIGEDLEHLKRIEKVENYFTIAPSMITTNNTQKQVGLIETLRQSIDKNTFPKDERAQPTIDFYRKIAQDESIKTRTEVYAKSLEHFDDCPARDLANELIDSLYMWNEARIADSHSETTSSGVESDDPEIRETGHIISKWADALKCPSGSESSELRPVLHNSPADYLSPLDNAEYRAKLLTALAAFWTNPEIAVARDKAANALPADIFDPPALNTTGQLHLLEYWQKIIEQAINHTQLGNLLESLSISANGHVIVKFRKETNEYAEETQPTHDIGLTAPGFPTTPDTAIEIRASFGKTEGNRESQGASIRL
jgi:hypothetical protein